jgi:hypothetical protein
MASSYLPGRAQASVAHPPIAFVAHRLSCNRVPVPLCFLYLIRHPRGASDGDAFPRPPSTGSSAFLKRPSLNEIRRSCRPNSSEGSVHTIGTGRDRFRVGCLNCSEKMLRYARSAVPEVKFQHADIRRFRQSPIFRAAIYTVDSLSHIGRSDNSRSSRAYQECNRDDPAGPLPIAGQFYR